ncbi:hypothetical protein UUU_32860 [Klebsiella pneumoniae subsp. pneumoniae DSM 30104 = JCM 1662 = NBRC 14940]|nr:hypothetical protein UUU_32860 [Klebsiella pneumoniae subsp. pneumoniae DSM 30104 = JCM 1662 = NBRC 14940]
MIVAFKFRGAVNADHRIIVGAETTGLARAAALLFHRGFKTSFINLDVALAAHIGGQVDREAVGVVQTEGGFAVQGVAFQLRQLLIQQRQAALEGAGKLLFFGFQHLLNLSLLLLQLVAGGAHHIDQRGNQFPEEGVLRAQHVAVTDRAANDTTQHVAAVFIRRDHAVGNQEGAGANVVGDNAQQLVRQIGRAGDFRHAGDQIAEQVDVIVGVNVLQHRGNTLQTHTGVDGRLRQRLHSTVSLTVELHEDDVPNLNVTVAIFFRASRRAAPDVIAVVKEDFGARAARTGVAHLPEVVRSKRRAFVVADADNTLARNAYFIGPDVESFVIGLVNGNPQFFFRQREPVLTGQQFPRVFDGILLEVIAKAEVAQHFKEGVVTRGVTDVFQIVVFTTRTHATLCGGRTRIITFVETKEDILELVHPCIGKQQGRIVVRHQGAAGNYLMSLAMEKVEKRLTDLSGALAHNYPEIKLHVILQVASVLAALALPAPN